MNISAEAVNISDALGEIQSNEIVFSFSGNCQYYYSKPYIFEICWNISNKTQRAYNRKRIAVSDESKMTVWYEDSLKKHMSGRGVTAALADVLKKIKAENPEMKKPMMTTN